MNPTPQFTNSIAANVSYWRQKTQNLDEQNLYILGREQHNLFRATEFGLSLPDTQQDTIELILQCFPLVVRRGYWRDWISVLEQVQANCSHSDLQLYGRILDHLGIFYRFNRQLEKAISTHTEEEQIGLQLHDSWRLAHARINLGVTHRLLRNYDTAESFALQALADFQAINAPPGKFADVFGDLGLIAQARGLWSEAESYYRQALAIWQQLTQPVKVAKNLNLLGQALMAQGDTKQALQVYKTAINTLSTTESQIDEVSVLQNLGNLYFMQGQYKEAENIFLQIDLTYLIQSGNFVERARTANNLGNVCLAQERYEEAEQLLKKSIELWRQINEQVELANSLGTLAETKASQNQVDKAHELFKEAIDILKKFPDDAWAQQVREEFQLKWTEL